MAISLPALALAAALAGCPGPEPTPNELPVAVLAAPEVGEPFVPLTFSGAESSDPDGVIIEYRFVFADGSPVVITADPVVAHTFDGPSIYGVALTVFDDRGGSDRMDAEVIITGAGPPPPECKDEDDCPVGEQCVMGTCTG